MSFWIFGKKEKPKTRKVEHHIFKDIEQEFEVADAEVTIKFKNGKKPIVTKFEGTVRDYGNYGTNMVGDCKSKYHTINGMGYVEEWLGLNSDRKIFRIDEKRAVNTDLIKEITMKTLKPRKVKKKNEMLIEVEIREVEVKMQEVELA